MNAIVPQPSIPSRDYLKYLALTTFDHRDKLKGEETRIHGGEEKKSTIRGVITKFSRDL